MNKWACARVALKWLICVYAHYYILYVCNKNNSSGVIRCTQIGQQIEWMNEWMKYYFIVNHATIFQRRYTHKTFRYDWINRAHDKNYMHPYIWSNLIIIIMWISFRFSRERTNKIEWIIFVHAFRFENNRKHQNVDNNWCNRRAEQSRSRTDEIVNEWNECVVKTVRESQTRSCLLYVQCIMLWRVPFRSFNNIWTWSWISRCTSPKYDTFGRSQKLVF